MFLVTYRHSGYEDVDIVDWTPEQLIEGAVSAYLGRVYPVEGSISMH